ncbi:uncharacterized protein [Dermacentor andersoni]|uniref:uncharacterized protein n=1 Tax=Dermacentor andersoni TaxID=34620 RepID=UPI002155BCD8|nr:uncharacterized protein LOC126539964 [Dermacentor andersoni]
MQPNMTRNALHQDWPLLRNPVINADSADQRSSQFPPEKQGFAHRCAAWLVPARLRQKLGFGGDATREAEDADDAGGGAEPMVSEDANLRREVESLDELALKLEDLAATLREALLRASAQSPSLVEQTTRGAHYFVRFQLPIVAFVQILWVGTLATFDCLVTDNTSQGYRYLVHAIMIILQAVNVLHVGLASWTLTHQLIKFRAVSGFLMAQTYLSTVLLFSGFYLVIYRLNPSGWEVSLTDPMNSGGAFTQYVRMLYLSVSSATLCGAANIQPVAWYATLSVCVQSLVNFVYFASILAQTIGCSSSAETVFQRRERIQTISRRLSARSSGFTAGRHGAASTPTRRRHSTQLPAVGFASLPT